MKIKVVPFAQAIITKIVENKTVVVIDVLRATSVMITALTNGAKSITPVLSIEEAFKESDKRSTGSFLLCGERDAMKIEGFHLGNSPLEYSKENVCGKEIILTTTNGTEALHACKEAEKILIAAFLNTEAVANQLKGLDEIVLVCSGTRGNFSLDDAMCAAMIMDHLSSDVALQTDDLGKLLLDNFRSKSGNLNEILKDCFHLNYLIKKGYQEDVAFCLQENTSDLVPVFYPNGGYVK